MKKVFSDSGNIPFAIKLMCAVAAVVFSLKICVPLSRLPQNQNGVPSALIAGASSDGDSELKMKILTACSSGKESFVPQSTETPADIIRMEEEYIKTFSDCESAGEVKEVYFEKSGATDIFGKVAVKNIAREKNIDFERLLQEGAKLSVADKTEPTVLIFHTHTTESYLLADNGVFYDGFETHSTDSGRNIVRVGNEICSVLEKAGIGVIHDTEIHDEDYNSAYAHSRKSVLKYLEEYPSIKITLDVHRDAIYYSKTSHCKPTAEINGKKAAQIMIISGAEIEGMDDFPDWENNLRFSLEIQKKAQESCLGLMKPIFFCHRKYNMDVTDNSLLIEIGSDANTLEEAVYSAGLFGGVLADIINCHADR